MRAKQVILAPGRIGRIPRGRQFQRGEVLFREAERLDVLLWLKSLFRDKEPLPTTGQAFFGLALLIGLRWFSLGFGNRWTLEMRTITLSTAPLVGW